MGEAISEVTYFCNLCNVSPLEKEIGILDNMDVVTFHQCYYAEYLFPFRGT